MRAVPMRVYAVARMALTDASDKFGIVQAADPETLRRLASDLARDADEAMRAYERTAWIRYAVIFVPVPFVVLIFRLHMQAWHYYLAGGAFLAIAVAMYVLDVVAVEKRDRAIGAARRAVEAWRGSQALVE